MTATRPPTTRVRRERLLNLSAGLLTACIVVVAVFPVYWMLVSALQGGSRFDTPSLLPTDPSLDAVWTVIDKRPVLQWFSNSALVALSTAAICSVLSVNAGYILARYRNRTSNVFGLSILFTQMLPATLLLVPLFVIMRDLAMVDSLGSLIVANTAFALPLSIWLMRGFVESLPPDLEEQAMVDGCSRFGAFLKITVPLLKPGLVVVVVFSFLLAWNDFFFARSLIFNSQKWVLSVGLTTFRTEYTIAWPEMMAAAAIFSIPAMLFFALVQRHLVSGLTAGSVKG